MALQGQWSLGGPADSPIAISRGILKAATSDNVQPLAILACERFGNTLAMCPETCLKIERTVLPTPPPAVLKFLRGVVGYSAHDCATHLGSSLAGIQFLGLAAALVTTMNLYEGAVILSAMLKASASDKTLLPTVTQLKDLLSSIEPRCHRSGFADEVVGWQIMLQNAHGISEKLRKTLRKHRAYPSCDVIEKVVDVFRQLHRLGDCTVSSASFTVHGTGAWLIAFTKWCLALPPSVYLDDGTPLLVQPGHKIAIFINTGDDCISPSTSITIHHTIKGPEKLLGYTDARWNGMVPIETFGQLFLAEHGLISGIGLDALVRSLPRAIACVLLFANFSEHLVDQNPELEANKTCPFPPNGIIFDVMRRFMNLNLDCDISLMENEGRILDHPAVQAYFLTLEKTCLCEVCQGKSPTKWTKCAKSNFENLLLLCACIILGFSLFEGSTCLQVSLDNRVLQGKDSFTLVDSYHFILGLQGIVSFPETRQCSLPALHNFALSLVGHDTKNLPRGITEWAMSSFKGQTIYYKVLGTQRIVKRGYLCFSWHPGFVTLDGEKYNQVSCHTLAGAFKKSSPAWEHCNGQVFGPANFFKEYLLRWDLFEGDGFLSIGVSAQTHDNNVVFSGRSPSRAVETLKNALVIDRCDHDADAKLEEANDNLVYVTPSFERADTQGSISIVAVDGADDLRYLATVNGSEQGVVVFRNGACLGCCVELCEAARARSIVL